MSEELDELTLKGTAQGTEGAVYGIDLGTTYSAIARLDENGRPEIIKNLEGFDTTPSVVFFNSDDDVAVGKTAKDQAAMEPGQAAMFIKRHMGEDNFLFTPKDRDGNPVARGYNPVEISTLILRKLVKDASEAIRSEIKNVIITCPAYFGSKAHEATKAAGLGAELNVLHVINEPTAAAIARSSEIVNEDKNILVYDLGGGTFDVTALQIKNKEIRVVCSGGDKELGGKDWDDAFANYLATKWREATGSDVELMASEEHRVWLMLQTEQWKMNLTQMKTVRCNMSPAGLPVARIDVTREEFDELTSSLLDRTISSVESLVEEAARALGVEEFKYDELLMVGGSSLMPQVKIRLQETFGMEPILFEPHTAVAKGAAVYQTLEPRTTPGLPPPPVKEVLNKSYGVFALKNGNEVIYNLLLKNTPIQDCVSFSYPFKTPADRLVSVDIRITESEGPCFEANKEKQERFSETAYASVMDSCVLNLPPNCPKGDIIDVTFTVNKDMVLSVTAIHRQSGEKIEVSLKAEVEIPKLSDLPEITD